MASRDNRLAKLPAVATGTRRDDLVAPECRAASRVAAMVVDVLPCVLMVAGVPAPGSRRSVDSLLTVTVSLSTRWIGCRSGRTRRTPSQGRSCGMGFRARAGTTRARVDRRGDAPDLVRGRLHRYEPDLRVRRVEVARWPLCGGWLSKAWRGYDRLPSTVAPHDPSFRRRSMPCLAAESAAWSRPSHIAELGHLCERGELAHDPVSQAIRITPRDLAAYIAHVRTRRQ
jgi:hypothetical protein